MKKINKKGFTLIELLAVIVVLAIVLVVTIPSVLTSMQTARNKQFTNAASSVKEWFEKQYEASNLGEEYASPEYIEFLNTVCSTGTDEEKANCRKLSKYTSLTDDVVKAAGLDSNDIDANNSYVAFSEDGKAEVNLVTKENSKFSNEVLVSNTNDYTNLFDLSKRIETKNKSNAAANAEKEILITNYYYNYNALGVASQPYYNKITELSIKNNEIHFINGGVANFGILVPFNLNPGSEYRFEFTRGDNDNCSKVCIETFKSNGVYLSNNCLIDNSSTDFTFNNNNSSDNTNNIVGIFFYCDKATGTAEFNNITLKKIS